MSTNWAAFIQPAPNVGEAFNTAFQQGTERRRQEELRSALRGAAMNPGDPNAVNAFIQADPVQGMQFRQQQAQQQQAEQERRLAQIIPLARNARALPYEQRRAYIQSVLPHLQQVGINPQMAADFDPTDEALDAYLAYGPQQERQGPNIQREVEYYRSIGRPEMADQLLARHAQGGPMVANNGDGTFTIIPQSAVQGGGQSPQIRRNPQTGETVQFNPQSGQWEPMQGGQTPPASGSF